jgi:hypothetical protein
MKTREDRPRQYFRRLFDRPEDEIDYGEIPLTTRADWEDAEVLLPVNMEEFRAIKEFINERRQRAAAAALAGKAP